MCGLFLMATAQLALRKSTGEVKAMRGRGAQLSNVWNGDNLENRHTALDSADS